MTNSKNGTALKNARVLARLSQGELAELSGVNFRMIQHYEQGTKDINGAKLYTLLLLCIALDCGIGDIIDDEETIALLKQVHI